MSKAPPPLGDGAFCVGTWTTSRRTRRSADPA